MVIEDRWSIRQWLRSREACDDAIDWAAEKDSLTDLWEDCQDPAWVLWALELLDYRDASRLRLFAASCARRVSGVIGDDASRHVLEVAEGVANRTTPESDLGRTWQEIRATARSAARHSGWSAARAAALTAVAETLRADALEAARGASTHSQRAVAWHSGMEMVAAEAQWQADRLRDIFAPARDAILQRAGAALDSVERP